MGTTKLLLYNGALEICGEREIASLTENREPRRLLDSVWARGAVNYCLEQGQWKFATRSSKLEYAPAITPAFGYRYAFEQPSDMVRLAALCSDEYFNAPVTAYSDENRFWFSDLDEIYIKYVSNDNSYGNDLSVWPETFSRFVEYYLASRIIGKISQNASRKEEIDRDMQRALVDAKSKDAMAGPTQFPPSGSWVQSRIGRTTRDLGSRGRLTG